MPETKTVFSGRRPSSRSSRCSAVSTALSPAAGTPAGHALLEAFDLDPLVIQSQQALRRAVVGQVEVVEVGHHCWLSFLRMAAPPTSSGLAAHLRSRCRHRSDSASAESIASAE